MYDNITKPFHYGWHPSGVEAKEVTDDLPRWLGDAITYIWRRNHKGQPLEDRRKAIERLNEATPERIEVFCSTPATPPIAATLEASTKVRDYDVVDPLVWLMSDIVCETFSQVRLYHGTKALVQKRINFAIKLLEDELDELTATAPNRTPTIYEEQ